MTSFPVPNEFPSISSDLRLAVIGEAPGQHEELQKRPFVGASGQLLNGALQSAGVLRSSVFVGNICQHRPPNNDIEEFDKSGWEIQEGLSRLQSDLNKFQPNCCLLLGATPLWAAKVYHSVSTFRGTIFSGLFGHKCVSTYHPAAVLRQWDWAPLFQFDVSRAIQEAKTKDLFLPQRRLETQLSPAQVIEKLASFQEGVLVSIDIEGGVPNPNAEAQYRHLDGVSCIALSTSPLHAWIIPLKDWEWETRALVMQAFARFMKNPRIPKVLQNGLYDVTVLAWVWKIHSAGVVHDTMLSGWELFPELPKGLGTQASIYTREPYYKYERKVDDNQTHYSYCCKDAAVTLEIHEAHMAGMQPTQKEHYNFNVSLLPSLQFMTLRGIRYDREASNVRKAETQAKMLELQLACNQHAGREINLNSPKQMQELLYRTFRFEPIYAIEKGKKTDRLTANADAMLKLIVRQGQNAHPFLRCALQWKKLEGARKQLEIETDYDGRVRCSYNLVGTETGRLSCQGSVTGSGTNLQTIMKENRKFFIADDDHYFFQCDLEGADGWTVAAHCAELGDPTMLDDYFFKLKPAKIIALMYEKGESINKLSREEIKKLLKQTPIPDDIYAVCKVVQHGTNYMMGPNRMSENLLEKSFKKSEDSKILWVPPSLCTSIQNLYFKRYPGVKLWQQWVEKELRDKKQLPCASGHIRTFFGRPGDKQTLKEALAHEPQANTTFATNAAMFNLWHDAENRDSRGHLIIQPLHSVHDALCGQFPKSYAETAVERIRSYFSNPIRIRNTTLTIPFEGGYGTSWYDTDEAHRIGEI